MMIHKYVEIDKKHSTAHVMLLRVIAICMSAYDSSRIATQL